MAARIVGRLKSRQIANAKPPRGKDSIDISDGGNLLLQVTRGKGGHIRRSWTFKYELAAKRHELGLGPVHTIGLAEARDRARAMRQMYLDLHLDSFKNTKHRYQWRATLATYVYPKIGAMTVADIGPADVLRCIESIWNTKRETASRVRQRIERILDYAATRQYRSGDNAAAHVTESLPKGGNGRNHLAALRYAELPAFTAELRARDSIGARALEFTILTAARTGETIGATWDEFDLKAKTWVIDAARMKAGKEHKVPLCDRAVEILRALPRHGARPFPLSNMG